MFQQYVATDSVNIHTAIFLVVDYFSETLCSFATHMHSCPPTKIQKMKDLFAVLVHIEEVNVTFFMGFFS
jgi:hypothetical protein